MRPMRRIGLIERALPPSARSSRVRAFRQRRRPLPALRALRRALDAAGLAELYPLFPIQRAEGLLEGFLAGAEGGADRGGRRGAVEVQAAAGVLERFQDLL